jgi:hypothetical protein
MSVTDINILRGGAMSETQQVSQSTESLSRSGSVTTARHEAPVNTAVWIRARGGPMEAGPAPYPAPRENEVVVRNHAVAANPLDWGIQLAAGFLATGRYHAAVAARVIGHGLQYIQAALDAQRNGVSAEKIVVSL